MNTRNVVEKLLGRMASDSPEAIAELFAPEVDFMCAGSAPWIKPRHTRGDMAAFFAEMEASFVAGDRDADISAILVDGSEAVVMGNVSQKLKSNGEPFTIPFALHLTVEEGMVVRYHVYEDSLTVARAVAG